MSGQGMTYITTWLVKTPGTIEDCNLSGLPMILNRRFKKNLVLQNFGEISHTHEQGGGGKKSVPLYIYIYDTLKYLPKSKGQNN